MDKAEEFGLSFALPYSTPRHFRSRNQTLPGILYAKRTGWKRYPSEKKQPKLKHKQVLRDVKNKFEESKLGVSVHYDPDKDFIGVSDDLLQEIAKVLGFPVIQWLLRCYRQRWLYGSRLMRERNPSLYIVDMDVSKLLDPELLTSDFISRSEPKVGFVEHMACEKASDDLISVIHDCKKVSNDTLLSKDISSRSEGSYKFPRSRKPKIDVVGSGPSGLFASHILAEFGADVTLIQRGQAVEQRGSDIGALVVRRILERRAIFALGRL